MTSKTDTKRMTQCIFLFYSITTFSTTNRSTNRPVNNLWITNLSNYNVLRIIKMRYNRRLEASYEVNSQKFRGKNFPKNFFKM